MVRSAALTLILAFSIFTSAFAENDNSIVEDGLWVFSETETTCFAAHNLDPEKDKMGLVFNYEKGKETGTVWIVNFRVTDEEGRPLKVMLSPMRKFFVPKTVEHGNYRGYLAYRLQYDARRLVQLVVSGFLDMRGAELRTLNMQGGYTAKRAMRDCVKTALIDEISKSLGHNDQDSAEPVSRDLRFCRFGYCPCDTSDPDYGGADSGICRSMQARVEVSDEMFVAAAAARDARREIRLYRE